MLFPVLIVFLLSKILFEIVGHINILLESLLSHHFLFDLHVLYIYCWKTWRDWVPVTWYDTLLEILQEVSSKMSFCMTNRLHSLENLYKHLIWDVPKKLGVMKGIHINQEFYYESGYFNNTIDIKQHVLIPLSGYICL